jgi:copper chaperone CopZ
MTSMTYQVTGMTCEHCVRAVTEEIETLAGVNSVTVALVPGGESAVTVTTDAPLTTEAVAAALDEAGAYHLSGAGDEDGEIIAPARTLPLA